MLHVFFPLIRKSPIISGYEQKQMNTVRKNLSTFEVNLIPLFVTVWQRFVAIDVYYGAS